MWNGYSLVSGGQTQRMHSADLPAVREEHLEEGELIDFEHRKLDEDAEVAVRAHLDTCATCRERLEALHLDDGTGATKVRDPMVGRMLGEYRVEAALARGGMGVVYRGVQPMIGKQVAIKVLIPEAAGDGSIDRLLEEARAVNAIRHPNIIDIFSFGALPDGRHYFVMALLSGQSLDELIQERRVLPADQVMTVLEQSLSALGAAHAAGVIHRDLKPANLFVSTLPDGSWHVTVLDFGLAKRLGNTKKTSTNIVMGTPGFMAPEQIRGKGAVPQTDLYAMGVVAWVLLTGDEPFHGEGIIDLMRAHLDQPLPSLAALAPKTPAGLINIVERLLAKDPDARPRSAMEVHAELRRLRGSASLSGAPAVRVSPVVRADQLRKATPFVPAGMPSAELSDAMGATHVPEADSTAELPDLRSSPTRIARALAPSQTELDSETSRDRPVLRGDSSATTNDLGVTAGPPSRTPLLLGGIVTGVLIAAAVGWFLLPPRPQPDPPKPIELPIEKPTTPVETVKPVEPPVAPPKPVVVPPVEPPKPVEVATPVERPKPVETPKPVKVVPRPPAITAAMVQKRLDESRLDAAKLSVPAQRRIMAREVQELADQLKEGKSPAAISKDLEITRKRYGLR